jgi:hypothetical protein
MFCSQKANKDTRSSPRAPSPPHPRLAGDVGDAARRAVGAAHEAVVGARVGRPKREPRRGRHRAQERKVKGLAAGRGPRVAQLHVCAQLHAAREVALDVGQQRVAIGRSSSGGGGGKSRRHERHHCEPRAASLDDGGLRFSTPACARAQRPHAHDDDSGTDTQSGFVYSNALVRHRLGSGAGGCFPHRIWVCL